ncbi:MAG: lysophospholipid acyltransferase family protein [Opitutaceae bacterium]
MTLRFEISPESVRAFSKCDEPVAFVLWHNRLFLATEIHRRYRSHRKLYALISASKDGAWLAEFFTMVGGLSSTRGSSSRLGREAANALVEVQRAGHDIGITPDGPRGPCYDFKSGAVIVPRRTGAPLILVGGVFTAAWRFKSWDRFYLPLPFSRVQMTGEVVENSELADRDAAVRRIQARLLTLNPDRDAPA